MSQLTSTARHQSVSLTARVAFCSSSPGWMPPRAGRALTGNPVGDEFRTWPQS